MKRFLITIISAVIISALLSSCGWMITQAIAPNTCQKCTVQDPFGNVVWSEEDCGGNTYNMDIRCKAEAYDRGCDYRCVCETFRKEPESK